MLRDARARDANAAWAVLRDARRRAAYDRQLAARRPVAAGVPARRAGAADAWATPADDACAGARRHAAYSDHGRRQRAAFHRASLHLGLRVLMVAALVLLVLAATR